MLRRIAVSLAVPALAALAIHTALVYGHAEYDHSTPNAGQVVPTAPAQVDVYFTEEVAPAGTNTLNVLGPGNVDVDNNDATIDGLDESHMTITLQGGLPNGVYTVEWHTTSADDGDQDEGTFHFTVGSQPVGGVALDSVLSGDGDGSGRFAGMTAIVAAAVALLVLSATTGAFVLRRRH